MAPNKASKPIMRKVTMCLQDPFYTFLNSKTAKITDLGRFFKGYYEHL